MDAEVRPIKKTVILDPRVEVYIRKTWAILIESGVCEDPTYSSALNFMLVGLVLEAGKSDGLSAEARESMWDFAQDRKTIFRLADRERLDRLQSAYRRPPSGTHDGGRRRRRKPQ